MNCSLLIHRSIEEKAVLQPAVFYITCRLSVKKADFLKVGGIGIYVSYRTDIILLLRFDPVNQI